MSQVVSRCWHQQVLQPQHFPEAAGVQSQFCYCAAAPVDQAAVKTATLWEGAVRSSSGTSSHVLGAGQVLALDLCLNSPCWPVLCLYGGLGCAWYCHSQTCALFAEIPWDCIPCRWGHCAVKDSPNSPNPALTTLQFSRLVFSGPERWCVTLRGPLCLLPSLPTLLMQKTGTGSHLIYRLLNGIVMDCSYAIALEEVQVNQVLLGSKVMKFKNI